MAKEPFMYYPTQDHEGSFVAITPFRAGQIIKLFQAIPRTKEWAILAQQKLSAITCGTKNLDEEFAHHIGHRINNDPEIVAGKYISVFKILTDPRVARKTDQAKALCYKELFDLISQKDEVRPFDFAMTSYVSQVHRDFAENKKENDERLGKTEHRLDEVVDQMSSLNRQVEQLRRPETREVRRGFSFNVFKPWG